MILRLSMAALAVCLGLLACGGEETVAASLQCETGEMLCGGACADPADDPRHCGGCGNACAAGEVCSAGACAPPCPADSALCDGACQDLNASPLHCGGCGLACGEGEICVDGSCADGCPATQTACGGACFTLEASQEHCGACGNACAAGEVCSEGSCATACPEGQSACGGACHDLQRSPLHCGGCDSTCSAVEICLAGACSADERCPAGFEDCDGMCRPLQSDRWSCGGCGIVCGADELCMAGVCERTCQDGFGDCDGACRDLATDRNHCGGCGVACAAGEACEGSACVPSCGPFASDVCGGRCTTLAFDAENCGACGNACPAGEVCSDGVCSLSCGTTLDICDGGCTTTAHDPENCGGCGNACPGTEDAVAVCVAGRCDRVCGAGYADCDMDFGESGGNGCEVHLPSDPTSCGACGVVCPGVPHATAGCTAGVCGIGACVPGRGNCDQQVANGCETSLLRDDANCGACGVICAGADVCVAGSCLPPGEGESCSDPFVLSAGENVITRRPATLDHFSAAPSCSAIQPIGGDLVLRFDATRTGRAEIVVEDAPNGLRRHLVVAGQACGTMTPELVCVSDPSRDALRAAFVAQGGSSYFVYLADAAAGSLAARIPLTVRLREYDCATYVPSVIALQPAQGAILDGAITVEFESAMKAAGGTVTLTGDRGTVLTLPTDGPAITFSADGRLMTIDPGIAFPPGEVLTVEWTGLEDANCGAAVASPAWSFVAAAPPCSPGVGGMVGDTVVTIPTGVLGEIIENFVASDQEPNGFVYVGNLSELMRFPKAGGPPEPIHLIAGLGANHLGYDMLIDGRNFYVAESKTSGVLGHLFRISTDGGSTWRIEDAAEFGTAPTDDIHSLAAWDGRIYMLTHEGTLTVDSQIWSIHGSGVSLPAIATLDRSFGATAYRYCAGLVVDDLYFYTNCLVGSNTSAAAVLRIDRATGAITTIADGLLGNTTNMALHGRDHDGDGIMDFLYRNFDRRNAHYICDPAGTPHVGLHHAFGPGTGNQNFGLGYDRASNVLWQWHDLANNLIKVH